MPRKPVEQLSVEDVAERPVWKFVGDDAPDETYVEPVESLPVESLFNRVVGLQVSLRNGRSVWAIVGNLDTQRAERNEQFLTIAIEHKGSWFHLARYHDLDRATRGPAELAKFLEMDEPDVFPISYDVSRYVAGGAAALSGQIPSEPSRKLSRDELIALAVR